MSFLKSLFAKNVQNQPKAQPKPQMPESYYQMQAHLQQQNQMLMALSAAEERYKNDNDLPALIAVYESLFWKTETPLMCSSDIRLVDLYLKNNENDKAWAYLNYLSTGKTNTSLFHIRYKQAKILKSEGKHIEAVRMFLKAYLNKCKENSYPQREAFIKDIKVSCKKLGWAEKEMNELADILSSFVKNHCFNEQSIDSAFKSWLANKQN